MLTPPRNAAGEVVGDAVAKPGSHTRSPIGSAIGSPIGPPMGPQTYAAFTGLAAVPFTVRAGGQAVGVAPASRPSPTAVPDSPAQAKPQSAEEFYQLGLTYAALDDDSAAGDAFRQATELRPDMGAAWIKLAETLGRIRDAIDAEAAYASLRAGQAANQSPPSAGKKLRDEDFAAAERRLNERIKGLSPAAAESLLRTCLLETPADAACMRVLAETWIKLDRHGEAEKLLVRALELAPSYAAARHSYAIALFRRDNAARAIPQLQRLLAAEPDKLSYRALLAACFAGIGEYGRAIELYESTLKRAPRAPALLASYGSALKSAGRRADCERACRACLDVAPASGDAYLMLSELSAGPLEVADIAAMHLQLARSDIPPANRVGIHYALGATLEKAGDYANSFAHFAKGAQLRRAELVYDPNDTRDLVRRAAEFFTPSFLASRPTPEAPDRSAPNAHKTVPIFVVGLPRSGSTLIEQILASHSAIEGTIELPEIGHLNVGLGDRLGPYPECLAGLDADALAALGRRYLEDTRVYRKTSRPFFVDKMLANWLHIGLIHLILPDAKIIDARRDPMATGFGAFKKCFGHGQPFSYDLTELGLYYNEYVRLMTHFDTVLPGRVHRVIYENMVADTETEIRRLLDYCGLPVEPGCLRFWETERSVSTASSEQVRRPIFREGLERWRNYEPWLAPLKTALESSVI
jgi:tetratricopeptide (TPR) repeat protein